jgi:hypothetical protein
MHPMLPTSRPRVLFLAIVATSVLGCTPPSDDASRDVGAAIQQQVEAARNRLAASEGGQLVMRAIEAHGGLAAWYRAPTSSYTWEYANTGADIQFKSFLVADNRTRRVYHDLMTLGPYGDPEPVDARFAWTGEVAWMAPGSIGRPNPHF